MPYDARLFDSFVKDLLKDVSLETQADIFKISMILGLNQIEIGDASTVRALEVILAYGRFVQGMAK